jgi:hypothetical protein
VPAPFNIILILREPLKIHFGGQANLFDSGRRQAKAALASTKADLPSLPEVKKLLLAAQKQLLELPLTFRNINFSNQRIRLRRLGDEKLNSLRSLCGSPLVFVKNRPYKTG